MQNCVNTLFALVLSLVAAPVLSAQSMSSNVDAAAPGDQIVVTHSSGAGAWITVQWGDSGDVTLQTDGDGKITVKVPATATSVVFVDNTFGAEDLTVCILP